MPLTIAEYDDAGALLSTYIESPSSHGSRVDVIHPKDQKSAVARALDVFLPAGYPGSVSGDYLDYQIYDSLQAFASSIAGMLSSRAVLEGIGIGDATASPTAALLLSVLQESMGRIATILFAHRLGSALEPECKMYRLLADIFNDAAMILDCLSPVFPKPVRVVVLGFSSVLRSLCGVAAGSAKASLSAHFATRGNLGELGAKDSSQETVISLLGMLAGSLVVSWVSDPGATWGLMVLLLALHLGMNHRAVRAVQMRSLNRQRAGIVFAEMFKTGTVLRVADVAARERVFERDGVLRWDGKVVGHARIGVELGELLGRMGERQKETGAVKYITGIGELMELYEEEEYILWFHGGRRDALIVLKQGATPIDQLKAWAHALLVARAVSERLDSTISKKLQQVNTTFQAKKEQLAAAGWALDVAALETRPGRRVAMLKSE